MSNNSVVKINYRWLTFYERTDSAGKRVMSVYRDENWGSEQVFIGAIPSYRSFKEEVSSFIAEKRLEARLEYESWQEIEEGFDEESDSILIEPTDDYNVIIVPDSE